MVRKKNITIIGAGAWGTALALLMARGDHHVYLMPQTLDHADELETFRENKTYFPGVPLDSRIHITCDREVFKETDIILWVIPAQYSRGLLSDLKDHIPGHIPIIVCSKGIDCTQTQVTHQSLLSVIINKLTDNPLAVLSGPNFALEVAQGMPAAATLASNTLEFANTLAKDLSQPLFQLFPSDDIIGVQVTGAIKNVLAIASGLVAGKGLGQNINAALITQGLAEIRHLGIAMGAQSHTFFSLAGMGDLILTCTSTQSRNTSLGFALADGQTLDQILASRNNISEGVYTAKAVHTLAKHYNVDMPICNAVYRLLYEGETIHQTLASITTLKPL